MGKLSDFLAVNDILFCGEGYLFELEKRGYVQIGPFVPTVALDYPEAVKELHRELANCGSHVIEAFTYNGHRDKLKLIGQEDCLEKLNRRALKLAKEVADEYGLLMAGSITCIWDKIEENRCEIIGQFEEQITWAKEEGADYIIAETLNSLESAKMALEVCQKNHFEVVITFSSFPGDETTEGISIPDACLELEKLGATVVGLNCTRGPATMLPLLDQIIKKVNIPVAGLPVLYNTTDEKPTMQALSSEENLYMDLERYTCTRKEAARFAREAKHIGVKYMGICCGGSPYHLRAMVEELGGITKSSRFSADLDKYHLGDPR